MDEPYEFLSRTGDGVCVVDGRQRIVLWNEAASSLLGFTPEDVLGRPCYEVLGDTDESGCTVCRRDCAISRAVRGGQSVASRDVRLRTRDAARLLVSVSTIALPSAWHELSVLAHLFRKAGLSTEPPSIDDLLGDPIAQPPPTGPGPIRPIDGLTRRESEVLRLLSRGASTGRICIRLGIAKTTARAHVRSILSKLGVRSRLEAVTFGLRSGLLAVPSDDEPESRPSSIPQSRRCPNGCPE